MSEYDQSQYHRPQAESVSPVWGAPSEIGPQAVPDPSSQTGQPTAGSPVGSGGKRKMSTVAKTLTAVGVAAVVAVGGTVAITSANAASSSASAAPGPGAGMGATGSGGFGNGGGRSGAFSLLAGALHGEFVVGGTSGTTIERMQTGSVTALGPGTLAVKSTDNFAATYAIPASVDVSAISVGSTVTVVATVSGSTLNAISVTDSTATAAGPGVLGNGSGNTIPGGQGFGNTGQGNSGSGPVTTAPTTA